MSPNADTHGVGAPLPSVRLRTLAPAASPPEPGPERAPAELASAASARPVERAPQPIAPVRAQLATAASRKTVGSVVSKEQLPTIAVVGKYPSARSSSPASQLLDKGLAMDQAKQPGEALEQYAKAGVALRHALGAALGDELTATGLAPAQLQALPAHAEPMIVGHLVRSGLFAELPAALQETTLKYFNRAGLAQKHAGDAGLAAVYCSQALALSPAYGPAHYNMACATTQMEDANGPTDVKARTQEALDHLEAALSSDRPFFTQLARSDPDWNTLRSDARFRALVGLPALPAAASAKPTEAPRSGWAPSPTSRPMTASRPTSTVALPPDRPGPFSIDEVRTTLTRDGRTVRVTAEVPRGLDHAPLVLFLPGFQLDSASYQGTTKHLASQGFTVVRVDPDDGIGRWDHREMTNDALAALNWATAADGPLAKKVDPNAIGIAGHSLGGKLATMAALKDPRIKAVFAIDPVNQRDPDLFTPGAESIDRLAVPFGVLGQTVDTRGGLLRPAATPEGSNFQAFFDRATNSPGRWAVTLPGADHFDFTDGRTALERFASNGGTARREDVVQATRTLATTFFRDALKGEALGLRSYVPPDAGWQQR